MRLMPAITLEYLGADYSDPIIPVSRILPSTNPARVFKCLTTGLTCGASSDVTTNKNVKMVAPSQAPELLSRISIPHYVVL